MDDAPATGTTFDRTTTVHEEVKRWVRDRGGRPIDESGDLGFRFPDDAGAGEPIGWGAFFERFEEAGLAFAYDSEAGGDDLRAACDLIDRERAGAVADEPPAEASDAETPERVGQAEGDREAEKRSTVRTTDAREQENVDNHRDEPPFQG